VRARAHLADREAEQRALQLSLVSEAQRVLDGAVRQAVGVVEQQQHERLRARAPRRRR
jgi:hypothetical protein